ncbi:TetR/AcrR family transcriptional regulator [Actinoplanes sp. NPDC049265]|uniref:TetR/AcrR family transcriptional regulator n=1 Tax=Actinoplanes sp. NPDC049265 TaxID=3363902 RepID=UPI003711B7F9
MSRIIAEVQTPGRRRRSEGKKTAILDAAENLFVTEGYERTSVDAITALAQVSKRTLYNHFGDKETIFLQVLSRANDALLSSVRAAIDEEITTGRDLHEALSAFAHRVIDRALGSSDYLTFRRLITQSQSVPRLPEAIREHPLGMLEQRFAELADQGELRTSRPRTAAGHFTALTISLAQESILDGLRDQSSRDIDAIIAEGVDAFLRAYR